ncbi:hypothetical protein SLH46_12465 [Draconibacterium sp. IB214405]|uniref:DUF6850 family outer membrane beta-barrel protein n=1 Tax=Draconibacterium sp. IB214405 TaxID=3097352 RepID=UPI002A1621E6|nr:DUF6850 family outer membrane beta-barrel protein [Draconibacterium sp. IB214405]MDX8340005.1 hypothetical protein [Draconibacterium sp. IB214405]
MNRIKHITFFLIVLVALFNVCRANSSDPDSLRASLSTESILLLKSPWSVSDNAAGLQFLELPHRIGRVSVFYNDSKGDYHLFQQGREDLQYGFYTNGYTHLKNWNFYGDFSYYSQVEKESRWTDVMESYNDNPYTLGDDIGGKYIKEYFDMNAKAAWHANEQLNVGFEVNYQTGVGTRRKDPRPVNKATDFRFKPGIVYSINKFNVGLNLKIETAKEDIEVELVADSTYTFYHFKGLGVFTSSYERDLRTQEATTFGGALQFGYNGSAFQNMTEISFFQKETDIKRGVSVPLQVVLLENFQTDVNSVFLFGQPEQTVKRLKLSFNDKHIYGHEPVVEPKQVQENYQWSTAAKYVLYWHQENTVSANYDYYKLVNNNHYNWGMTVGGELYTSESSYYFVPEKNEQQLKYFSANAAVKKEMLTSFADLIFEINGKYQKGFDSYYKLVDEETLLKLTNTDFVENDFEYYNAAMSEIGAKIGIGKRIKMYREWMQMYLNANYTKQYSKMINNPDRTYINLQFGINF